MPGIWPLWASSLRQMRQRPNLRYTARGRPHRLQRVYARVLNFGGRACLTRSEVLAIYSLLSFSASSASNPAGRFWRENGMPSPSSSANASTSVFAVVVMVMSMPRIWSIES